MSLKTFHVFFIVASFLLSAYFGGWSYREYNYEADSMMLFMAIGSFAIATSLLVYLIWILKRLRNFSFLSLVFLSLYSNFADACGVCIGNPNSPLTLAVNEGVWALLFIIGGVLIAFGSLFLYWRARSKNHPGF